MGSYFDLDIGSYNFSWKNYIPDVISVIFEAEDFVNIKDKDIEDYDYTYFKFISNSGTVLKRLNKQGVNIEFLKKIYFDFYRFNIYDYKDQLEYRCKSYLESKAINHKVNKEDYLKLTNKLVCKIKILNEVDEFNEVLKFYKNETQRKLEVILDPIENDDKPTRLDFYKSFLMDFMKLNPYTHRFQDEYNTATTNSEDLDILFHIGMCVHASPASTIIEFNFTEYFSTAKPLRNSIVRTFLNQMNVNIIHRFAAYRDYFRTVTILPKKDNRVKYLSIPKNYKTSKEKGDFLEKYVYDMFSEEEGFTINKNVTKTDEEVDLVIINNINDPFWISLHSPFIIIECKNREKKTEPKDIRDFEIKLRNRTSMCRLGIIVSMSGFTKGCDATVDKLSREGYTLILVDKRALDFKHKDNLKVKKWLEIMITKQL